MESGSLFPYLCVLLYLMILLVVHVGLLEMQQALLLICCRNIAEYFSKIFSRWCKLKYLQNVMMVTITNTRELNYSPCQNTMMQRKQC